MRRLGIGQGAEVKKGYWQVRSCAGMRCMRVSIHPPAASSSDSTAAAANSEAVILSA